jgi:hypothetical protein
VLEQILQIFFGKEHRVKNWLISTLDLLQKEQFFSGLKNLSSLHKIGDQLKNLPLFKNMLLSGIALKISMV